MPDSDFIRVLLVLISTYWPYETVKLIAEQPSITSNHESVSINNNSAAKSDCKAAAKSDCEAAAKSDCEAAAKSDCEAAAKSDCEAAAKSDCDDAAKSDCEAAVKSDCKPAAESDRERESNRKPELNLLQRICQLPLRVSVGFLILTIMIIGTGAQLHTCFSRQNPYSHWVEVEDERTLNENLSNCSDKPNCKLKCHINKNLITGYFFPYAIIGVLALWMYLIQPIYILRYKSSITNLNKLIKKLSSDQVKNLTVYQYVIFSFIYIVFSIALNIGYLYAFGILEGKVVIESKIFSNIQSTSSLQI